MNIELPDEVLDAIAAHAAQLVLEQLQPAENGHSPYLTIAEAATFLRSKRHRVDDLLSRGTLTRHKDGSRTLILRAELEDYIAGKPTGRAAR